jgi:hypothetical protein
MAVLAMDDKRLFDIFAEFMWREVDILQEYCDLPDVDFDTNDIDFEVDLEPEVRYFPDPDSDKNKSLMEQLHRAANAHNLTPVLALPNEDLVYDIIPNLVDIEVAQDEQGKWRIQPSFSMR